MSHTHTHHRIFSLVVWFLIFFWVLWLFPDLVLSIVSFFLVHFPYSIGNISWRSRVSALYAFLFAISIVLFFLVCCALIIKLVFSLNRNIILIKSYCKIILCNSFGCKVFKRAFREVSIFQLIFFTPLSLLSCYMLFC